jgi:hypothetical protein
MFLAFPFCSPINSGQIWKVFGPYGEENRTSLNCIALGRLESEMSRKAEVHTPAVDTDSLDTAAMSLRAQPHGLEHVVVKGQDFPVQSASDLGRFIGETKKSSQVEPPLA